jgi:hypothetical protein
MTDKTAASILEDHMRLAQEQEGRKSAGQFGAQVFEGLHIAGVVVNPSDSSGKSMVIVTSDGVKTVPSAPIRRGVRVGILFISEHGDDFIREFHFHKGETFTKDVEVRPPNYFGGAASVDIWRD